MEDLRLWLGGAGLTLADWQFPIVSGGDKGEAVTRDEPTPRVGGGEMPTPRVDGAGGANPTPQRTTLDTALGVERWSVGRSDPKKAFEFR